MRIDRTGRLWVALFAVVAFCGVMSTGRWLMAAMLPGWAVCCPAVQFLAGVEMPGWLTHAKLAGILLLLLYGSGSLLWRLWKTRRFDSGLRAASIAIPPARIKALLEQFGLSPYVTVLATDTPLAFCCGLFHPRIGISTGLASTLTDRELSAVLLHEDYHRRRYDPLRGILVEAVAAMAPFLPVAAELRDWFFAAMEVEADRYAVRLAGRPSLAGALHKLLTHPLAVRFSVSGISGLTATEVRLAELLGDNQTPWRLSTRSLLSSTLIVLLACILLF